jgi:uncharacterized protein YjbI with pentapeptide repeats
MMLRPFARAIRWLAVFTAIATAQVSAAEPPPASEVQAGKENSDGHSALRRAVETDRGGVGANLKGVKADGIEIDKRTAGLLSQADLTGASLRKAKLTAGARAFYETKFDHADLTNARLTGAAAFQKASFKHAKLDDAVLEGGGSGLQIAVFDDATLVGARLIGGGSSFQGASFARANLTGAVLQGEGPALQGVNLDHANCANLQAHCTSALTAFQAASLNNTQFAGADLSSLADRSLGSCVFKPATPPTYDKRTRFPAGFSPANHGWRKIP